MYPLILSFILCFGLVLSASCNAQEAPETGAATEEEEKKLTAEGKNLFDGKTLKGWEKISFGGSGDIEVEDEAIILYMGEVLTGIKIKGEPPLKMNYEISLEAKRIDGVDFFCALTFPIGETHSTFVVGGWGGSLVGISSIDNMDASENETGSVQKLEDNQWYKIRVRVTDELLQAWIDEREVVKFRHEGREMGMRFGEIEACVPLGIATFQTKAAIRNIRLKRVPPQKL